MHRDSCHAGCLEGLPFLLLGKGIAAVDSMQTCPDPRSLLYLLLARCLFERFAPLHATAHTLPETAALRDTVKQQIAPGVIVPSRGANQDLYGLPLLNFGHNQSSLSVWTV